MKVKQKTLFYKFNFDGTLLEYRLTRLGMIFKYFLSHPIHSRVEFPVSYLLDYKHNKNWLFGSIRVTINRYRFGHKKPYPITLGVILLTGLPSENYQNILQTFDKVKTANYQGSNSAMNGIEKEAIRKFYTRDQQQFTLRPLGIVKHQSVANGESKLDCV
ncbi:MAG: hypothetical protein HEP71_20310 [Roseivirga sp.]|nr:hypothetical protein [Roseivirga sp.]